MNANVKRIMSDGAACGWPMLALVLWLAFAAACYWEACTP